MKVMRRVRYGTCCAFNFDTRFGESAVYSLVGNERL